MIAGIAFSVVAAIMLNVGNVVQKHSVGSLPELSLSRSHHLVRTLLTSRTWVFGFVLCLVGVGFQTVAFSLTPLPVAQSIFNAGIVSLILISRIKLHERLGRQELYGILVVIFAIVAVSVSLSNSPHEVGDGGSGILVIIAAFSTLVVTGLVYLFAKARISNVGLLYGIVAGLLYGVASLGTKGASTLVDIHGVVASVPHILTSAYPYVFIIFSLLGMLIYQTGLQRYRISVVGSMSDVACSCYLVALGSVIFGEHWPSNPLLLGLRLAGFAGVLVGSVIVATAKKSDSSDEVFPTEADIGLGSLLVAELKSHTAHSNNSSLLDFNGDGEV